MSRLVSIITACLALGVSAAASASDIGTTPVLRVDQGNIMISVKGSAFAPATTGKALAAQERLMVAEDSAATVVYDNGCKHVYDKPGVYLISPECDLAAAVRADGSPATAPTTAAGVLISAAPVIATGVVGAAILVNQPESEAAPISR